MWDPSSTKFAKHGLDTFNGTMNTCPETNSIILYTARLYSDHVIRNHYFKTKWVQEMNFTIADLWTDKSSCSKVEVLTEVQLMFNNHCSLTHCKDIANLSEIFPNVWKLSPSINYIHYLNFAVEIQNKPVKLSEDLPQLLLQTLSNNHSTESIITAH